MELLSPLRDSTNSPPPSPQKLNVQRRRSIANFGDADAQDDIARQERVAQKLQDAQDLEERVRSLCDAVACGNAPLAQRLIDTPGAPLDVGTRLHGTTALHKAVMYNQPMMVALLVSKGARVDSRDIGGRTPLMIAAVNGHADILRELLTANADVKARSSMGMNAVSFAAAGGHVAVLRLLLERDGSLDEVRNSNGDAAVDLACSHKHESVHTWLLARKAVRETQLEAEAATAHATAAAQAAIRNAMDTGLAARKADADAAAEAAISAARQAVKAEEEAGRHASFTASLQLEQQRSNALALSAAARVARTSAPWIAAPAASAPASEEATIAMARRRLSAR